MSDNEKNALINEKMEMLKFTGSIAELSDELLGLLESIDSQSLNAIKPYLPPRKNIVSLIEFYDIFQTSNKEYKEIQKAFQDNKLLEISNLETIDLSKLDENNVLEHYSTIRDDIVKLSDFKDIKIVSKFLKDAIDLSKKILALLEDSTLECLKRLPKIVERLDVYVKFVIENGDQAKFLKSFTNICIDRLGFVGIENNRSIILQRTKDLSRHFKMIMDFNKKILGSKICGSVNRGMIKLMILDLKKILQDELDGIRIDKKSENIPFLIELYSRLKHSQDIVIQEIEELFSLKDEILSLIFTCFIEFFAQLDLLREPNKNLRTETVVNLFATILKLFEKTMDAKRIWVDKYGSSFGVHSMDEMNSNFIKKIYLKIVALAKELDIESNSIYMINNIYKLDGLTDNIDGRAIKDILYKNCETIVGIWKINHGSLSGANLYVSLIKSIENSKKYFLPEKELKYVSEKIGKLIENLVVSNDLKGNKEKLLNEIQWIYRSEE